MIFKLQIFGYFEGKVFIISVLCFFTVCNFKIIISPHSSEPHPPHTLESEPQNYPNPNYGSGLTFTGATGDSSLIEPW